jgi:hypothetical protein
VNTIKQAYGFRRFDKVEYQEKAYFILGLRSSGYFSIGYITGEKIHDSVKYNKLRLLESAKTLMFERKKRKHSSLPYRKRGLLL